MAKAYLCDDCKEYCEIGDESEIPSRADLPGYDCRFPEFRHLDLCDDCLGIRLEQIGRELHGLTKEAKDAGSN